MPPCSLTILLSPNIVRKIMVLLADEVFKKKWFKKYDSVFTRESSKFHKLELLISKLVKFISLLDVWSSFDDDNASVVRSLFLSGSPLDTVWSAFSKIRKTYCSLKITESKHVEESHIKSAINKRIESFKLNKGHTIQSILERPFCKVVLDHLVVDNKLILKPGPMKSRPIEFLELFGVVSDLPIDKTAGFSGISNKLWMHNNRILLVCSAHDILHGDNFSVLKSTTTQTPIFAIGSVVEDALEKNRELWLNRTNWVMTDFSLTNGYSVHDGLNQGEVFSFLLWHIFYDPLLCEVKHQESVYRYKLNSHFVSRSGHTESHAGFSTFFTAGAFVDNTIWVGSSQTTTQHILNVASEFFQINDILINNDKTVAIPINSRISNPFLFISSLPISIAKKGESYQYLGIFLLTDGLSKPNLAKAHSDVHFFSNLVLKKVVSDKQFLYLVLAVLQPIVNYKMQFSFVSISVCDNFANSCEVLGQLFSHKSYDLQVLCWHPIYPLSSPARTHVCVSNNFLSGLKKLDPRGLVPEWFGHSVAFLSGVSSSPLALSGVGPVDICGSDDFVSVCNHLSRVDTDNLSVYTDRSVKNLGMTGCRAGAAAFFEDINLGLGVYVQSLMSSILAKLQTIALALKCVPVDCSVCLFSDSQTVLDACKSEVNLVYPDFHNWCWVECQHIRNIICKKNLRVSWHKVKGHSGVLKNDCADSIANAAALSDWFLPSDVAEWFLLADGGIVSGNSRHFVQDVFRAICQACWEISSGSRFLAGDLHSDVNWLTSSRVWHPDLHMTTGFTSKRTADIRTYLMKALYYQLPVAI
ncbi:hypothetical protein G9A89_015388 [Geosiphon pyriformis]|nr:hypothetical protein G9A89_015388 [Geosiphon pyriformis]